MNITFIRENFLQALQAVMGVVERRHTIPILSNVLLQTKDDNIIELTATDLEIELKSETKLESVKSGGAITIPGRKLFDIIKILPENVFVHLALDDQKIIIKAGRARYVLTSLPAEGYPSVEKENIVAQFELNQGILLKQIQQTHYAMAHQDVRYFLNGICWDIADNRFLVVALDGHRFALSERQLPDENKLDPMKVIIPRKCVSELMRLLEESEDKIHVKISSSHISIKNAAFSMNSKLIEGQFPGYQPLLKQKGERFFIAQREALKKLLAGAAVLCNDKMPTINLSLEPNLLKIKVNNPEQEQAEDELEITYEGENIHFCFNIHYLLDVLNAMDASTDIKCFFNNADSALFIEPVDDSSAINVIMPLRL